MVENNLPNTTTGDVPAIAKWSSNKDVDDGYSCPSMRQMGLVPRDIMNTGPLTTSQYSDDHFLTRVKEKSHILKVS